MSETAIVTGGTQGLGRALSLAFARRGRSVVAVYRADDGAAESLRALAREEGLAIECLRHDLSRGEPPALAPSDDVVLVHNAAAPFTPRPLHLITGPELAAALDVAATGALAVTRAVLPAMVRARRGTIVGVLSTAVEGTPPRGFGAYVMAKSALDGLIRAVAAEYGARGVRAFSVCPGFMRTAMTAAWDPALAAAAAGAKPVLDVDEVARRILLHIDDPDAGRHGERYVVDG